MIPAFPAATPRMAGKPRASGDDPDELADDVNPPP